MTDRELLELAAKAAGIEIARWLPDGFPQLTSKSSQLGRVWNPLTDDGDALRLAVKLRLHVETDICFAEVPYEKQCEATRRAVVRAAAEIGKGNSGERNEGQ